MKIKCIWIKFPLFASIHTANVLGKPETWVFYSSMRCINLGVCASGIPSVTRSEYCIKFWKQVWSWASWSSENSHSPFCFPLIFSSWKLLCSSVQGTLSPYPHHPYLLPNDLFSVCIIFLGPISSVTVKVMLGTVWSLPRPLKQKGSCLGDFFLASHYVI